MTRDRERAVSDAFVSIANSLVDGYDVADMLTDLLVRVPHLLDVSSAGLLLADSRKVLHVVATSSEATRNLQLFQIQRDEGPCLDCYHSGAPVSSPDLAAPGQRWPAFAAAASAAGTAAVHAVPMRLRDQVLGSLGLFSDRPGGLDDDDLNLGQALAHVASVAIVQDKALSDKDAVTEQLQTALTSRVVLEQAKGVLAQKGELDMADAFAALRHYARSHGTRLTAVARAVVARELSAQVVLDQATAGGTGGRR